MFLDYMRLALVSSIVLGQYSYAGYIHIDPDSIATLPEETETSVWISLKNCSNWQVYSNTSVIQVQGLKESLKFPSFIENVPCCPNSAASLPNTTRCGKSVNFIGAVLGFVELKLCTALDNTCQNYSIGVTRPPKQVKDDVFLYGAIVGSIISTIFFGVSLELEKVKSYFKRPIIPILGMACQFIVMPMLAFVIGLVTERHKALEFGIFAAGVVPGGGMSNAFAYLLGGDVDLSITMTFLSTVGALAFVPLWMYTLGKYILGADVSLPFGNMAQTLAYVIVPVAIGLLINKFLPKVGKHLLKAQKFFLPIFVVFIIITAIYANIYAFRMVLYDYQLALASMLLPYIGGFCGLIISLAFRQSKPVSITIALETGVQNAGLATILLRTSLPQPWADISSAIPICLSLFTPLLLNLLYVIRLIYLRVQKCREKPEHSQPLESKDVDSKEESVSVKHQRSLAVQYHTAL